MNEKFGNIILRFCPNILNGRECLDDNCPYIHTKDEYITMDEILRYNDKFIKLEQENSKRPANANPPKGIPYMPTMDLGQPFLCIICGHPVKEESGLFLSCCNKYCCMECYDKWKYPGRCPRCGSEDKAQVIDGAYCTELSTRNAIFDNFTIMPKQSIYTLE